MQQNILNKFSTPAKQAMIGARALADKIGAPKIEPEHLLAALSAQKNGLSREMLRKAGINLDSIKSVILENYKGTLISLEKILESEPLLKYRNSATLKNDDEEKELNRLPSDTIEPAMPEDIVEDIEREIMSLIQDPFYNANQVIKQGAPSPDNRKLWHQSQSEKPIDPADLKLGTMAQKIVERAVRAAAKSGNNYIGSEHLLAGLLETPNQTIDKIFEKNKIDIEEFRNQINIILNSTARFSDIVQPEKRGNFIRQLITGEPAERPSKTQALDAFATNLTTKKNQQNIDKVIGRDTEIERLINILSRRTKNNPILIGEPGVGKTAIVMGLAKKIMNGEVPDILADKEIFNLDLGLLVAGTSFRGDFENRIKQVIKEVKQDPNIILFIDEIHNIIGAGNSSGAMDAANLLKPALSQGDVRCIGATTPQEYKKFIEPDPALERRFQAILINESSKEEAIELINGIAKNYEKYHRIKITPEAVAAAVRLSDRYIQNKFLPDKAIDLIDEAASGKKVKNTSTGFGKEIKKLKAQTSKIMAAKEECVNQEKFSQAMKLKQEENRLIKKMAELYEDQKKQNEKVLGKITEEEIVDIISKITSIPKKQISWKSNLVDPDSNFEEKLSKKIVGQTNVIKETANVIRRHLAGLSDPKRPLGSFMFLGPSGVGKTELAKVIAQELFHDEKALIRFDMTEFAEGFSVSKLVGAPAGYVGYRESGKLTEAVKNKPYSIVLFDEIEKAHQEVRNLLLQILDDGKLTDATGREINFKNTIIVMTSNIGLKELNQTQAIGFGSEKNDIGLDYEQVKEKVLAQLKKDFNVEFLNRIDKTLVFRPLTKSDLEKITELQILELNKRLIERDLVIKISDKAKKYLAQHNFTPEAGAREIRKNISDLIEDPLADALLKKEFGSGDVVNVEIKNKKVVLI